MKIVEYTDSKILDTKKVSDKEAEQLLDLKPY